MRKKPRNIYIARDLDAWAQAEAKRRGTNFSSFISLLIFNEISRETSKKDLSQGGTWPTVRPK